MTVKMDKNILINQSSCQYKNLINNNILTAEQIEQYKKNNDNNALTELHVIDSWIPEYQDNDDIIQCIRDNISNGYFNLIINIRKFSLPEILAEYPNLLSCIDHHEYGEYFKTVFANIYNNKELYYILDKGFTTIEALYLAITKLGSSLYHKDKDQCILSMMG